MRARLFDLPGGYHLLVGREIDERLRFRRLMVASFLWALALTVVLGSLGGWLMSRKVLGQVDAFARASRKIADGDLSQRMAVRATGDEFDRLAVSLNDMLEQIDRLTDGMRSVVDSVAHDLRGPLTRLRSRIELSLRAGPDTTRYGEALEAALEESDRILRTLNVLLQIAQAEAGKTLAEMEALDLAVLVRDLAELYQPLAEERAIVLETAATGPAWIAGHGELLTQALVNLLDNALKHTGRGGLVKLSVEMSSRGVEASVADNGPGIAAGERKRALERFVRLDTSAATHGSGLGLSLVAAVAHLHSAVLTLADNEPGLRVTLCFAPA